MRSHATKLDMLFMLGLYLAAHGTILFGTGLYWDDWHLHGADRETVDMLYRQLGFPLVSYYHFAVAQGGVLAYRIVVFLSHLASALCLFAVLGTVTEIDRKTRVMLVILFFLFPVFGARISTAVSWYSFSYALFFAGFWLVSVYLDTRRVLLRLASQVLFLVSFITHSLLVFYAVVILYVAYRERTKLTDPSAVLRLLPRYLDYLLLPFVFWALKLAFFQPTGPYKGYNEVTYYGAVGALSDVDSAVLGGFLAPVWQSFQSTPIFIIVAGLSCVAGAALMAVLYGRPSATPNRRCVWFLLAGIVFFVLGVLPYLAVGKTPSPDNWGSRHQLLTPLGASFMLVYAIKLLPWGRVQDLVYALFVVAFVSSNMQEWVDFQRDWYKQVALIENFKVSPEVIRATRIVIDDRTADLDANRRRYRYYEYSGLLRLAFGDDSRKGQGSRDYREKEADAVIVVEHGPLKLTLSEMLRLRLLESRDPQKFREEARNVLHMWAMAPAGTPASNRR